MDKQKYKVIYRIKYGSHSYGTNTEDSDIDIREIYMPTLDEFVSMKELPTINVQNNETDLVAYDIRKFFSLAIRSNPSVLEWLYAPKECILHIDRMVGSSLIRNRDIFLSKEIYYRFQGYAISEWRKVIGDHPEVGAKRKEQIAKYGYNLKSAMNGIRLMQQAQELLTKKKLTLPRPNSQLLLDIKCGRLTYEDVDKLYHQEMINLEKAFKVSKLPEKADRERADRFLIDLVKAFSSWS